LQQFIVKLTRLTSYWIAETRMEDITEDVDCDWSDIQTTNHRYRLRRIQNHYISPKIATRVRIMKSKIGKVLVKPKIKIPQSSQSGSQQQTIAPVSNTKPKEVPIEKLVKPIYVNTTYEIVKNFLENLQVNLTKRPLCKKITMNKVQLNCFSIKDKETVLKLLAVKQIKYHTFTENENKNSIFVLKGCEYAQPNDLLKTLNNNDIPAVKVAFLSNKQEYPVYLVHFVKDSIHFNTLQHKHKVVDQLIVNWDKIDPDRKRPTQCKRCQRWGHSARNCGNNFRCIKCVENHEPGQCKRVKNENPTTTELSSSPSTSMSTDTPVPSTARCVNCKGNHPANFRGCEIYLAYKERSTPTTVRELTARNINTEMKAPPTKSQGGTYKEAYPTISNLPSNVHDEDTQPTIWKKAVSFTKSHTSSSNCVDQSDLSPDRIFSSFSLFASIPNIGDTMDKFDALTRELLACKSQGDQVYNIMRFCAKLGSSNVP
jgi:hypothetical protein